MSRRLRRLVALVLWVIGAAVSVPGLACSIGSGDREQDQAQAFRSSDQVFIAELSHHRHVPPLSGGSFRVLMDYVLIDAIKGRPSQRGTLMEIDPYKTLPGHPPAPACGPWLLYPDAVGKTALIFVSFDANGDPSVKWVQPFSRRVEAGTAEYRELLDRIRHLKTADSPT